MLTVHVGSALSGFHVTVVLEAKISQGVVYSFCVFVQGFVQGIICKRSISFAALKFLINENGNMES
jgi:hypothetical protein